MKSAKYCIKLREIRLSDASPVICEICDTSFASKYNLQKHVATCSSHPGYIKLKEQLVKANSDYQILQAKLESKIEEKDKLIEKLQNDLMKISIEAVSRPTNITNNNNNTNNILIANLAPWDEDHIVKQVKDSPMTEEIYDEGLSAIASHYGKLQTIFQDSIPIRTCDRNRKLFQRKLPDGAIVKEKNAITFIKTIQPTVLAHAIPIHEQKLTDYDIATRYNKLIHISIPNHKKYISDAESSLRDIEYKPSDHPDKLHILSKIDKLKGQLKLLDKESYELKSEASSRKICLTDPDYHLDKMQKSADTLNKVKHLSDNKNASAFATGLIEVFP
jgi:hypothetical protein